MRSAGLGLLIFTIETYYTRKKVMCLQKNTILCKNVHFEKTGSRKYVTHFASILLFSARNDKDYKVI